jgi:hypothetical protein
MVISGLALRAAARPQRLDLHLDRTETPDPPGELEAQGVTNTHRPAEVGFGPEEHLEACALKGDQPLVWSHEPDDFASETLRVPQVHDCAPQAVPLVQPVRLTSGLVGVLKRLHGPANVSSMQGDLRPTHLRFHVPTVVVLG